MIDTGAFRNKLEFVLYALWGFAEVSRNGTCIDEKVLDSAAFYVCDMTKDFEKIMEEMDELYKSRAPA